MRKQTRGDEFVSDRCIGQRGRVDGCEPGLAKPPIPINHSEPPHKAAQASSSPFQFTGRENDETGLYYYERGIITLQVATICE